MMNENLSIYFPQKAIVIVTENYKGGVCVISANNVQELWHDWMGERKYVSSNEVYIFSAFYKGELINPYVCKDFLTLLHFLDGVDNSTDIIEE